MSSTEKFCLRWNDFEANISGAFRELREDKDFFDITLACDDEQVEAHKVILSACSPFFRTVLKRNKHQHPLVYLKGVRYTDLLSVLNFMYHGEVNVAQEELNSFLAVAEDLKVKGLTQNGSSSTKSSDQARKPNPQSVPVRKSYQQPPAPAKPAPPVAYQTSAYHDQSDDDIQEVVPVIKSEPVSLPIQPPPPPPTIQTYHPAPVTHHTSVPQAADTHALAATEDYVDYEGYDNTMDNSGYDDSIQMTGEDANKDLASRVANYMIKITDSEGIFWQCTFCKKMLKKKHNCKEHIEANHFKGTVEYTCDICQKSYSTEASFRQHTRYKHYNSQEV